jgi:GTP-binding protein Era
LTEQGYRSGFISIVGRPNVGKSTLMNALMGMKMAIVTPKAQTTRNVMRCILTRAHYQMVFIDTPGIHKPKNKLGEHMVQAARGTFSEVDAVLFLVDASAGIGGGDQYVAEMLRALSTPVLIGVNKIDALDRAGVEAAVAQARALVPQGRVYPISALKGEGLAELEDALAACLPEGPQYYPPETITDQPERVIVGEIIREKALLLLRDEIPHGIGVAVERMEEREDKPLVHIEATIYCEKKSHKSIVIGKGGAMLRRIGTDARTDIQALLGCQVFLELWVKIRPDWRDNPRDLKMLGYE